MYHMYLMTAYICVMAGLCSLISGWKANNITPEKVKGTLYEECVARVAAIDKEADYQEKRKLAVKGLRKCEKCGNVLVLDSAFCNKCGEKLKPLLAEENTVQNIVQNICPKCGSACVEGAAFCTSCGNKLG